MPATILNQNRIKHFDESLFYFLLQKVISCFEKSQGSGRLLDEDHFLLLQSSIVDKTLMCPDLQYDKLEESIQNTGQC